MVSVAHSMLQHLKNRRVGTNGQGAIDLPDFFFFQTPMSLLRQESRYLVHFGPGSERALNPAAFAGQLDPDGTWSGGGSAALALTFLGFVGVLLSYWCGRQTRALKEAMRLTKSIKGK